MRLGWRFPWGFEVEDRTGRKTNNHGNVFTRRGKARGKAPSVAECPFHKNKRGLIEKINKRLANVSHREKITTKAAGAGKNPSGKS
jgi:hypothetical protein